MIPTSTIPGTARFFAEQGGGDDLVAWALVALELGYESKSLLRLAIETPPFFQPDLRRLFEASVEELGIERIEADLGRLVWAQEIANQLQAGSISPSRCAALISGIFAGEDIPEGVDNWWELDELRNCEGCGYGPDQPAPDVDRWIREAAARLVAFGHDAPNSRVQPT